MWTVSLKFNALPLVVENPFTFLAVAGPAVRPVGDYVPQWRCGGGGKTAKQMTLTLTLLHVRLVLLSARYRDRKKGYVPKVLDNLVRFIRVIGASQLR